MNKINVKNALKNFVSFCQETTTTFFTYTIPALVVAESFIVATPTIASSTTISGSSTSYGYGTIGFNNDTININGWRTFNPSWEFNTQPYSNPNPTIFKFHASAHIGGIGSCGLAADVFYELAAELNLRTLQQIIKNWEQITLVVAEYVVATYFPILREAIVGAKMIADEIARLANMNCQTAQSVMNQYLFQSSDLVRACVCNYLGGNCDPFNLTTGEMEQLLQNAGQDSKSKLEHAYYYCENNATIFDAFGSGSGIMEDIKKFVNKFDIRKMLTCDEINTVGLTKDGHNYGLNYTFVHGASLKNLARLGLVVDTPDWAVDPGLKQIIERQILYSWSNSDGQSYTTVVTPSNFNKVVIKPMVESYIDKIYQDCENGSYTQMVQEAQKLLTKFNLVTSLTAGPMNYFNLLYIYVHKQQEFASHTSVPTYSIKAVKMQEGINNYVKSLIDKFVEMADAQVAKEEAKQMDKIIQRKQIEKFSGHKNSLCVYCPSASGCQPIGNSNTNS